MEASGAGSADREFDFSSGIIASTSGGEVKISEERFDHELRDLLRDSISESGIQRALAELSISLGEVFDHVRPRLLADQVTREDIVAAAWESDQLRSNEPKAPSEERDWTLWLSIRTFLVVCLIFASIAAALTALLSLFLPVSLLDDGFAIGLGVTGLSVLMTVMIRRRELRLRFEGARWRLKSEEREKRREQLVEGGIRTELRAWINEISRPAFSDRLTPSDSSGLKDLFDPKYEVPLSATLRLRDTLDALKAGSVGIAGPRGVGKSTLIQAACDGRLADVEDESRRNKPRGLSVSAPIRYGGQEFVRFLFLSLCVLIGGGDRSLRLERQRREEKVAAGWRIFLGLTSGSILASSLYVLVSGQTSKIFPLVLASIGGGVAVAALGISMTLRGHRLDYGADRLAALVEESLDQLRYTETLTEEQTGQLTAKWATLSRKQGRSRASQPWTFPEIVANYRDVVGEITRDRPLIIGIDELDKMASAEDARSFLNEMKSLFDQDDVYYLVSISEEALSDFERRGQPLRDVFESVFSDVLQVDFLSRAESESLLRRRAIGIPIPWPALFHSLAGGLPRESIRVARRAVRLASGGTDDLDSVTVSLIEERCAASEHAAAVIAQGEVADDGTQPVLSWLRSLPRLTPPSVTVPDEQLAAAELALRRRLDVSGIVQAIRTAGDGRRPGRAGEMERLVMELAASSYHALSCLEFFGDLTESKFEQACSDRPAGIALIDLLAAGHQDLARSPSVAWETVGQFRLRAEMDTFEYPALP